MKFFQPTGGLCIARLSCVATGRPATDLVPPVPRRVRCWHKSRPLAMSALSPVWSTSGRNSDIPGNDANDPSATWAAERSAKALFVPLLRRDIVPACTRPPAGGYGNPHPTARIRFHTGRRGSGVAARGARAAANDAGDRVLRLGFAGMKMYRRVPSGSRRSGLCRRPEPLDRIPLGGRSVLSLANTGGRPCASSGGGYCSKRLNWDGACGGASDLDDFDRRRRRWQSRGVRPCRKPGPAGQQRHGRDIDFHRACRQAARPVARDGSPSDDGRLSFWRSTVPEVRERSEQANLSALGRQVIVVEARSDGDIEAAFATLVQRRAGVLMVGVVPHFTYNSNKIVALAARHKIPAMYPFPIYAFRRRPDELRRRLFGHALPSRPRLCL